MYGSKKKDIYAGTNRSHWFMSVTKTGTGIQIEMSVPIVEIKRMIAEAEAQNVMWLENGVTGKSGSILEKKNLKFKKTYAASYFKRLAKSADEIRAKEDRKSLLLKEYEANKDDFETYKKVKARNKVFVG